MKKVMITLVAIIVIVAALFSVFRLAESSRDVPTRQSTETIR